MNERIVIDPGIQHGRPVIAGTRVPVTRILGSLAAGMKEDEIIFEYGISRDDFKAALMFAAEILEEEQFYPLPDRKSA